jgi:hypothetical protein
VSKNLSTVKLVFTQSEVILQSTLLEHVVRTHENVSTNSNSINSLTLHYDEMIDYYVNYKGVFLCITVACTSMQYTIMN